MRLLDRNRPALRDLDGDQLAPSETSGTTAGSTAGSSVAPAGPGPLERTPRIEVPADRGYQIKAALPGKALTNDAVEDEKLSKTLALGLSLIHI